MDEVQKAIQRRNETILAQQMVMTGRISSNDNLMKGKPAADGEVRTWGGVKYVKQGKNWVEQKKPQQKSAPQSSSQRNKKQEDPNAGQKSGSNDQAKPKIATAEMAQLSRVKQALNSGDMASAAKIANSLSDEAKNVIPAKEWTKIHEHVDKNPDDGKHEDAPPSDKKETTADKPQVKKLASNKKATVGKAISDHATEKFKNFVQTHKNLFDTGEHAHPERAKAAKFIRGKIKGIVKGLKHELHHMKEAGSALKKVFTGKVKEISAHEKKALRKIGISLGLTVGTMLASGGASIFAHGASTFLQHLGVHFVEHSLIETAGLAAVFAKAIEDQLSESDDQSDDKLLELLANMFAQYIEDGDWSGLQKQLEDEMSDDEDSVDPKKNDKPKKQQLEKAITVIDDLLKGHTSLSDIYKPFTSTIKNQLTKAKFELEGEMVFQGLPIKIENKKGSVRKGTSPEGVEWTTKMKYPYGYISRTKAADNEHVDCYVGDSKESTKVFVVHQVDPKTKKYDEDKVMLGFDSSKEAKQAYLDHYDSPKFFGSMTQLPIDQFKILLKEKKGQKLEKAETSPFKL